MTCTDNSTVVITGASSGIGRALATEMARQGYSLGLTARRITLLEELRDELHAAHGKELRIELATLDVCQTASVGPALHDLFGRLGGVDTIIVNAGANDVTHIGGGDPDQPLRRDCDD
jgi:NADP-dependent 3-hydroxy acid dehydrogenase YdfG